YDNGCSGHESLPQVRASVLGANLGEGKSEALLRAPSVPGLALSTPTRSLRSCPKRIMSVGGWPTFTTPLINRGCPTLSRLLRKGGRVTGRIVNVGIIFGTQVGSCPVLCTFCKGPSRLQCGRNLLSPPGLESDHARHGAGEATPGRRISPAAVRDHSAPSRPQCSAGSRP